MSSICGGLQMLTASTSTSRTAANCKTYKRHANGCENSEVSSIPIELTSENPGEHPEEVIITLDNGREIRMTRSDDGGMELCNGVEACVTLPATAPEFLAVYEFFQTMAKKQGR